METLAKEGSCGDIWWQIQIQIQTAAITTSPQTPLTPVLYDTLWIRCFFRLSVAVQRNTLSGYIMRHYLVLSTTCQRSW